MALSRAETWQGENYGFCTLEHREAFRADAAGYFLHTMWGIPPWLYYASIALVLAFSFGLFEWREFRMPRRDLPQGPETIGGVFGLSILRQRRADRPRIDLLQSAALRKILLHPATRFAARAVMVVLFVIIVAAGLFGNQLPAKNLAPALTWTIWWCGLVLLILYAGAAWCYVCPWQALADWAEGLRFWGRKREGLSLGLQWPKFLRNVWLAIALFVFLTWLELGFGVTMNPRATAWLALAIAGAAFVCTFVFDRASFCRYGCFVGRIIGLYSLFAPIEVRTRDPQVCRTCTTKSCYRGNGRGEPCPTFQYLPAMQQNTNCLGCMECLKSCEQGNVTLQLRPWGEDLAFLHRPRLDEAFLALMMVTLAAFHGLTMTGAWRRMLERFEPYVGGSHTAAFTLGMAGLIIGPLLAYAALVALSRLLAQGSSLEKAEATSKKGTVLVSPRTGTVPFLAALTRFHQRYTRIPVSSVLHKIAPTNSQNTPTYKTYFVRYAYALLPIGLFYHLAHNSGHLLMEGQKVVALISDPFGREWDLFRTAGLSLAPLANLPTLWLIQVFLVLVGHVYSLWIARRVAGDLFQDPKAALRSQVPMLAAMVLFSLLSLWLLKQPMEMRASAM